MYSMDELKAATGKTPQTLYRQMRQNPALKEVLKGNTERRGNRVYYGEAVLQWFITFYNFDTVKQPEVVEQKGVDGGFSENGNPAIPQGTAPGFDDKDLIIAALKADLERERSEKAIMLEQVQELQRQNGNLLLLLNQEKQEKAALLPVPQTHKTIGERIKGLFQKGERE